MTVVRFASWVERQRWIYASITLTALSISLIAYLASGLGVALTFLPLTGFMSLLLAAKLVWKTQSYSIGASGESKASQILAQLDERYLLVRNWVPDEKGDIDLLLFGPFGALVIECKTSAVPIQCVNDSWACQLHNGKWRRTKSYTRQLMRNVNAIKRRFNVPVYGVIVFNDRCDLKVTHPTVKIIRRRQLLEYVHSLPDGDCVLPDEAIFREKAHQRG